MGQRLNSYTTSWPHGIFSPSHHRDVYITDQKTIKKGLFHDTNGKVIPPFDVWQKILLLVTRYSLCVSKKEKRGAETYTELRYIVGILA